MLKGSSEQRAFQWTGKPCQSMPRVKNPLAKPRCQICRHPERLRIEMARLSGASLDSIAKKFSIGRDAIWRHMEQHVDGDRRSMLVADVPLKELADRAAEEGLSLIDYLGIVRTTVLNQLLGAASVNDRHGTASLAGRATDVLREIGKLTGEILRSAPVSNVTNNTMVFMSSPAFANLERMLIERLAPHPEALRAVLDGLQALESGGAEGAPMIDAIPMIPEAQDARAA